MEHFKSIHHKGHRDHRERLLTKTWLNPLRALALAALRTSGMAFLCVLCACGESFLNAQDSALAEPAYLTPVEIKLSADGKKLFVVCEALTQFSPSTQEPSG